MAGAGKKRAKAAREAASQNEQRASTQSLATAVSAEPTPSDPPSSIPAALEASEAVEDIENVSGPSLSVSAGLSPSMEQLQLSTFDGNDAPEPVEAPTINKNLDLPVTIWAHTSRTEVHIQKRPPLSGLGRQTNIGLNSWNIVALPTRAIYQYDVLIGNGAEKKAVVMKVWESKTMASMLPDHRRWIFDRAKIAYSIDRLPSTLRFEVDLDAEEGRAPPADPTKPKKNTFRVIVRPTTTNAVIRFDQLNAYLMGKADFGTGCLEAINFLDHLLREFPSRKLTAIKRNFYPNDGRRFVLGDGAEAMKGTYASVRIGHSINGPHSLTVNVDVANGTFWTVGTFIAVCAAVLGCSTEVIANKLRSQELRSDLRRKLRHVRLEARHRSKTKPDSYCFSGFYHQSAAQYKMTFKDGSPSVTIAQYFKTKYKLNVRTDLPLVQMTKPGTLLPMELLSLAPMQRVNMKLNEKQTSEMIKFAVTPPGQRWNDIEAGRDHLKWKEDPFQKGFGMQISDQRATAPARILPQPVVQFSGKGPSSYIDPGVSGRWKIQGKRFLKPNSQPLKSWGVCVFPDRQRGPMNQDSVHRFMAEFTKIYAGHGGQIATPKPVIMTPSNSSDVGAAVAELYEMVNKTYQSPPQMLMFILPKKDVAVYGRIKKSCECRYGVMSQCMQSAHVLKAQGQYISNVCMKFNAKLGGITSRACSLKETKGKPGPPAAGHVPASTLIVAADVTHPAPASQGSDEARFSVAAIVQSQDGMHTRYTAAVESNGFRQEIIQTANWEKAWRPQLTNWMNTTGQGRLPQTVIYFRDGVSEGQFAAVIQNEVKDMKNIIRRIDPKSDVKFVVILATKRHHVRFFPEKGKGDNNDNALPGTLVETCVTNPYENDFFLCSHVALKGTARPVHYHILVNEAGLTNNLLQTMIYEQCYQFQRATTPVSLHPAVYYADICAERGRYHDKNFGVSTTKTGSGSATGSQSGATHSSDPPVDVPPLLAFATRPGTSFIGAGMWYI